MNRDDMRTCDWCLQVRHYKCRGCACTCTGTLAVERRRAERKRRERRRQPTTPRQPYMGPRNWKPGPRAGHNPLAGRSTLARGDQRIIEIMLGNGAGLSECARAVGTTRDKVRTIARRGS